MKNTTYYIRISGALLAICTVVALLLAGVNLLTRDIIAANAEQERIDAISAVFPGLTGMNEVAGEYPEGISAVYAVEKDDALLGHAVSLTSRGFGGDLAMIVGIGVDGKVAGVQVISHSETPGLGSKATLESYLAQYNGKGGTLALGGGVDAVSGATISSKAVLSGVNLALSLDLGGAQ